MCAYYRRSSRHPGKTARPLSGGEVVEQARRAAGCVEFSITADPDPVVILERWESRPAVEAFRDDGPTDEQMAAISSASVTGYDVTGERRVT